MTLMELMVSVAILSVMILAFNMILSQTQTVVSSAQKTIRANAAAAAVGQVIERDISGISKAGFLYINATQASSDPVLIFTDAGPVQSLTSDVKGLGSVIAYRLGTNTATNPNETILARMGYVLSGTSVSPVPKDVSNWDLAVAQTDSNGLIGTQFVNPVQAFPSGSPQVSIPPTNPGQVDDLWQVLTTRVKSFEVEVKLPSAPTQWVYAPAGSIWTHNDLNNWPVAIRITIQMAPNALEAAAIEKGNDTNTYFQFVCPVAR